MPRVIFGAADDSRLIPYRQPHRLGLVKLGILESRQPNQAVGQRLWQLRLLEKESIGQRHPQGDRHRASQLSSLVCYALPWLRQILFLDETDIQGMGAAQGTQNHGLDVVWRQKLNRSKKAPLVRIRTQIGIHEYAIPLLSRLFL